MKKEPGSIIVCSDGDVFLLLATNEVRDVPVGRFDRVDVGLVDIAVSLRGEHPVGKIVHLPVSTPSRVVTDVSDMLCWLADSGRLG